MEAPAVAVVLCSATAGVAAAAAAQPTVEFMMSPYSDPRLGVDTAWVLVSATLVFSSLMFWYAIEAAMAEIEGLYLGEHRISAYPDLAMYQFLPVLHGQRIRRGCGGEEAFARVLGCA